MHASNLNVACHGIKDETEWKEQEKLNEASLMQGGVAGIEKVRGRDREPTRKKSKANTAEMH